jgi:hypothetical protein
MAVNTEALSAMMSDAPAQADASGVGVSSFPTAPASAGARHFPGHSSVVT